MYIEDTLRHFGISDEEADDCTYLMSCNNGDFFRKELGIDRNIEDMKMLGSKDVKKVRIIIDYDADFPILLRRLIAR